MIKITVYNFTGWQRGCMKIFTFQYHVSTLKLWKALNWNLDWLSSTLAVGLNTCALWLDSVLGKLTVELWEQQCVSVTVYHWMLGCNGTKHGVEIHVEVVEYPRERFICIHMKYLLEIGGILVMPMNDQCLQVRRLGKTRGQLPACCAFIFIHS